MYVFHSSRQPPARERRRLQDGPAADARGPRAPRHSHLDVLALCRVHKLLGIHLPRGHSLDSGPGADRQELRTCAYARLVRLDTKGKQHTRIFDIEFLAWYLPNPYLPQGIWSRAPFASEKEQYSPS